MASNMQMRKSPYYERLSGDIKERYDEKIRKCGGIDPYFCKPKDLSSNSKDFPQITIYDIVNYMIHSVSSFTKKSFENYKGTEAYKFFESGFVDNIGSKKINKLTIVKGKVRFCIHNDYNGGNDTALRTIIFPLEKKRLTNLRDIIFLASLYNENNREKSLTELVAIGRAISINLTDEEAKEIFNLTLPRHKSKCFLGLRRGRITGSTFKSCCITDVNNPSVVTIKRIISPSKSLDLVPGIKYQIRNKKRAIQNYLSQAVLKHENFVFSECGLLVNPELPYFAGSPDGLVHCACHGDGCLEVKCFNIQEIDTLDDFVTRKPNNMFNKSGDKYSVERSHDLFYQLQLQINLNRSKYCDCIIWSPQKAFVVRVYANTDFWNTAMDKALKFHEHVVMPELLGKFYTENKDFPESTKESYEESEEDLVVEGLQLIALEIDILESDEEDDQISYESNQPPIQTVFHDLKSLSIDEICSTFDSQQEYLTDIYSRLIKERKAYYFPADLPSFAALDLITEKQFEAMVHVAEAKLVTVEQYNSTDVIFDAIIAEWTYKVFGEKYFLSREEAIEAVTKMNSTEVNNLNETC